MLTDITIPSTVKIMANHAFENVGKDAGVRFIVVIPDSVTTITAGTGAGWDTFENSGATLVALNRYTRKALYDGWYKYYESLADAQARNNLRYQKNDDPNFRYRGRE